MAKKKNWTPKKEPVNMDELPEMRLLCRLEKPRSPIRIDFLMEKGEDWFIEVYSYKKKTGVITDNSMITEKDFESWVEATIRLEGFVKVES